MLTIQFADVGPDGSRRKAMPLVTAFNLRREDPLLEIEEAVRHALTSIPALDIT
jgi:hypothetical protein